MVARARKIRSGGGEIVGWAAENMHLGSGTRRGVGGAARRGEGACGRGRLEASDSLIPRCGSAEREAAAEFLAWSVMWTHRTHRLMHVAYARLGGNYRSLAVRG